MKHHTMHAPSRVRSAALRAVAAAGIAVGVIAVPAAFASASVPAPVITVTPAPIELAPTGGTVVLHVTARDSATCTLSSSPTFAGLPVTKDCVAGTSAAKFVWSVSPPPNSAAKPVHYVVTVTAKGAGGSSSAKGTVAVAAFQWALTAKPLPSNAQLSDTSCSSTTFCMAVGPGGRVIITDSTGVHSSVTDGGHNLTAVSCLRESPTLPKRNCVAVDDQGRALSYNGSAWSPPVAVDGSTGGGTSPVLTTISCVRESPSKASLGRVCVAGSSTGLIYLYGGLGVWSPPALPPVLTGRTFAACASATSCVVADVNGDGRTFDPHSSTSTPLSVDASGGVTHATCASDGYCVVTDSSGGAVSFQISGGLPVGAMVRESPSKLPMRSASCTPGFCVAMSSNGSVYQLAYGQSGARKGWDGTIKGKIVGPDHAQAISCVRESPSKASCAAVSANGKKEYVGHVSLLK